MSIFKTTADMAAGDYPKSLFSKGVRTQDEEHIGHVMKETRDKVVVFGERGTGLTHQNLQSLPSEGTSYSAWTMQTYSGTA